MSNQIKDVMGVTMEKIREMVDVNTIIGDPLNCADGTIIIPISKVSFGFASGGSDLPAKVEKDLFGGGAGAGITISPVAFLVLMDGEVKLLQMSMDASSSNVLLNMLPDLMDKVSGCVGKKSKKGAEDKQNVE